MYHTKRFGIIFLVLLLAFSISACVNTRLGQNKTVYTTIYPIYDFAKKIGGEKIRVVNIVPQGVSPHDWEPTARDIANITKSDLVLYMGLGLDDWIEKVKGFGGKTKFSKVSENIDLIQENNTYNPHLWLSPLYALKIAENIKNALVLTYPADKDYFEANFEKLKNELLAMDKEYKDEIAKTPKKIFIVYHSAFSYLARSYGLNQISVVGLSDEEEPTPTRIKEVINIIKSNGIKYVFTEPLSQPKALRVIAEETGAEILNLHTLEGLTEEDVKKGREYISIMKDNLKNLIKALE